MIPLVLKGIGIVDNTFIGPYEDDDTCVVISNGENKCFLSISSHNELYPVSYNYVGTFSPFPQYITQMLYTHDVVDDIMDKLIHGPTRFSNNFGYEYPWRDHFEKVIEEGEIKWYY